MSDVSHHHHVHAWRRRDRVDGCHYVEIRRSCTVCGQPDAVFEERAFEDPMDIAFADRSCPRCRELVGEREWAWHLNP